MIRDLRLRGLVENRVLTGPETVHLDVTNGCNTNCITCWDHSPLLTIGRTTAWQPRNVPVRWVASTSCQASNGIVANKESR